MNIREIHPKEWMISYESIKRGIQAYRSGTSTFSKDEINNIQMILNSLDQNLNTISANPAKYGLPLSEIGRRRVLVDNLKRMMSDPSTREKGLRAGISGGPVTPGASQSSSTSYSSSNPLQSDRMLKQEQARKIEQQDQMLLQIEAGLGKLHNQALEIGDETKLQSKIIDEFESVVDVTTIALQNEAKHAEKIKEKTKMCYMYICIIVEVIILVLLLILSFSS